MAVLIIGFDSAWTANKSGALVGVLRLDDGNYRELGRPQIVDFPKAESIILGWQADWLPTATIITLDQPTIVKNSGGQRPVENIVSCLVSRRRGGMQPANTSKKDMFGESAPIWPFLARFGGPANPMLPIAETRVFETYPVLVMITLLWMLLDPRPRGRLPKYNPQRRPTFSLGDWQHVCQRTSGAVSELGLVELARWVDDAGRNTFPHKHDQDSLDACLCLLVAVYLVEQRDCLLIGDQKTGYIVVPHGTAVHSELLDRCKKIGAGASDLVRVFRSRIQDK